MTNKSTMDKMMLKWTPAVPIPNKDCIISSGARASNEKGFTPSYETEGRPNMYSLLNNEYMRIWFQERAQYEKEVYTKKEMMKEESKIKRRFVQKDLTRKEKKKALPIIKLKRFQNVSSKTENCQEKSTKPEKKVGGEPAERRHEKDLKTAAPQRKQADQGKEVISRAIAAAAKAEPCECEQPDRNDAKPVGSELNDSNRWCESYLLEQ